MMGSNEGPDTTPPDDSERRPGRDEQLQRIVDEIDENVMQERQQQGVPGHAGERAQQTQKDVAEQEPPD